MSDGVRPVSGPSSQPNTKAPDEITVQKDGTKLDDIAKDLGISPKDLYEANPNINPKKPLQKGQHVQYPKDMLVGPGEHTLEDVAKRLGMDKGELEKANPNLVGKQLRENQAFKFPKNYLDTTGDPQRGVKGKPRISSDGGPGKIKKGEGAAVYQAPNVKVGGRKAPIPDITIADGVRQPGVSGTSDTYDGTGEGNVGRRKQDQQNISNTRVQDERDLDDDTKKKLDDERKKPGQKTTDDQIRKGVQNKPEYKPNIKEEAAEIGKKLKEDYQRRLQQEAIDFVRRGGR
jgi:LysM domain